MYYTVYFNRNVSDYYRYYTDKAFYKAASGIKTSDEAGNDIDLKKNGSDKIWNEADKTVYGIDTTSNESDMTCNAADATRNAADERSDESDA
jgi:hypothetical protein